MAIERIKYEATVYIEVETEETFPGLEGIAQPGFILSAEVQVHGHPQSGSQKARQIVGDDQWPAPSWR